jgi:hypothetical protein
MELGTQLKSLGVSVLDFRTGICLEYLRNYLESMHMHAGEFY